MSRTEYMRELDALLQGISKEEREEAMQYYNDYFDDAGSENEEKVIEELGSPAKLAETIRAGINGNTDAEGGQHLGITWQGDRHVHAGNDFVGDAMGVFGLVQGRQ